MLYMILGTDVPASLEKRLAVRPQHLQRVEELKAQGRLVLAGPLPALDSEDPGKAGFSGSLIVAEFADLDAARRWAQEDPYQTTGVFAELVVKPFKQVLP